MSPLTNGTLTADGTEQDFFVYDELGKVTGYINLSQMEFGDEIVIRQYFRIRNGGPWGIYSQDTYSNIQATPTCYVDTKECHFGVRVTLEQTAGVYKNFEYDFVLEM